MATFEQAGEVAGNGSASAPTVLILSTGYSMTATGSVTGNLVLIMRSTGACAAQSSVLSSQKVLMTQFGSSSGTALAVMIVPPKQLLLVGQSCASSSVEAYIANTDIANNLRSNLPDFLRSSSLIQSIQRAHGVEAVRSQALVQKLQRNYFIDTADEESLAMREEVLGIKAKPGQTLQQRRERIKVRMQGAGIVTRSTYEQSITEQFYVCSVQESPSVYKIATTILSKRGVPTDINEMLAFADEILPAHLLHEFIYTYLPWDEAEQVGITWDEADTYSWDALETVFLIPFDGGSV